MPKKEGWQLGEGPYSKASEGLPMTRQPDKGYPEPKDISKKVDSNWKINDGFAGPLTSKD
jgi:hypothetical protein